MYFFSQKKLAFLLAVASTCCVSKVMAQSTNTTSLINTAAVEAVANEPATNVEHSKTCGNRLSAETSMAYAASYQQQTASLETQLNEEAQVIESNGSYTLVNFGTGTGQSNRASFEAEIIQSPVVSLEEQAGENGSIPTATPLNIQSGQAVNLKGTIGDGLYGSSGTGTGDFDFYSLGELKKGQRVDIKTDFDEANDSNYALELYSAEGDFLDFFSVVSDGTFSFTMQDDGKYYIALTDFFFDIGPDDPFDPASGTGGFIEPEDLNEGDYSLTIGIDFATKSFAHFDLKKGDVLTLGASIAESATELLLLNASGGLIQGASGPLFAPGKGSPSIAGAAQISHVVNESGRYTAALNVFESSNASIEIDASLPPLRNPSNISDTQTIFLDFDGVENLDLAIFADFALNEATIRSYEGVDASLELFNIAQSQRDNFIDAIIADVKKRLVDEIAASGINPDFDILIKNSRDHEDVWGQDNVTRVILAGNEMEDDPIISSSLRGIAESIDVGNFDTEQTAIVFLASISDSFAKFFIAPERELEAWSSQVGAIVAHELGHLLGAEHVFRGSEPASIMESDVSFLIDRGEDKLFGTEDDIDAKFSVGNINSGVRYGVQDTVALIALPNSSGEKRADFGDLESIFKPAIDRALLRLERIEDIAKKIELISSESASEYREASLAHLARVTSMQIQFLVLRSEGKYSQAEIDQAVRAFKIRFAAASGISL